MGNKLLTGFWRTMVGVPPILWEKQIEKGKHKVRKATRFMSPEHRSVHHYVVRELPRFGAPLPAEKVASDLDLPVDQVVKILSRSGKTPDFPVPERAGGGCLGLPGDRGKDPAPYYLRLGRAVVCRLSGGRFRDALRARAAEAGEGGHSGRHGMRPLQKSHAVGDRQ